MVYCFILLLSVNRAIIFIILDSIIIIKFSNLALNLDRQALDAVLRNQDVFGIYSPPDPDSFHPESNNSNKEGKFFFVIPYW